VSLARGPLWHTDRRERSGTDPDTGHFHTKPLPFWATASFEACADPNSISVAAFTGVQAAQRRPRKNGHLLQCAATNCGLPDCGKAVIADRCGGQFPNAFFGGLRPGHKPDISLAEYKSVTKLFVAATIGHWVPGHKKLSSYVLLRRNPGHKHPTHAPHCWHAHTAQPLSGTPCEFTGRWPRLGSRLLLGEADFGADLRYFPAWPNA
jgi:hypothetical protein